MSLLGLINFVGSKIYNKLLYLVYWEFLCLLKRRAYIYVYMYELKLFFTGKGEEKE